jgi:polyisoprenoid-binding protein YceI
MKRAPIIVVILMVGASLPALAAEIDVRLAPESTTIGFELKATMHTVHGTAALKSGGFTFDTATGAASGEVVVTSASADTANKKRDKKMHGKVLLSADHPTISIRAESLEGDLDLEGTSEVTLVGSMELLGSSHPVRVPMTVVIDGDTATVDAVFSVPYVEWGLKDPSTFVLRVGKDVPVTVHAEQVSVKTTPGP